MRTGPAGRRPAAWSRARLSPAALLPVLLPVLFPALLDAAPAGAWDLTGHQVTARIAWEHMTETARERTIGMLLTAPTGTGIRQLMPQEGSSPEVRKRIFFQWAAAWADLVRRPEHRGHRYDRPAWHYTDLFWTVEDGRPVPLNRPPAGEAVHRLELYRRAPPDRTGLHLAWLLHLVGDLHQPLHAASRVTDREPRGDRGGSAFKLGEGDNLHRYWDRILTASVGRVEGESTDDYVGRIAERVMALHPKSTMEDRLTVEDPMAWAEESAEIARTRVYPPELRRGEDPGPAYREHAFQVAAERAALAGYRIAVWLNRAFDPEWTEKAEKEAPEDAGKL